MSTLRDFCPGTLNDMFNSHVLVSRLSLDAVVLCETLDSLCAMLVIASSLQKRGTLHEITLPRSWLLRVIPMADKLRSKETNLIELYVVPMAGLLEQIYSADACALLQPYKSNHYYSG